MTGAMGDRVPPQTLTNAQEARLERLIWHAEEQISTLQPDEVRDELSMDWLENLVPGVPFLIPSTCDSWYEDLGQVQCDAWDRLTGALREFLEVHIDEDALKTQACGEG